MNFNMLI